MFARLQNFLIRKVGIAVKKNWINWTSLRIFYPYARLHFGSWMPSGVYKEIFRKHCYQPPISLPDNARIIDGGANIGLSVLYFLTKFPQAHVEAYEANPDTYDLLKKTIGSSKTDQRRYQLFNKALHTSDGTVKFFTLPDCPASLNASISGRDSLDQDGIEIEVEAVDFRRILEKPVDFLKLDVEGHEYQLLTLPEVTPKSIRSMIVEFHDLEQNKENFINLINQFYGLGYEVKTLEGEEVSLSDSTLFGKDILLKIYAK
ncbi:MAG: FkbM family methyltransferase [Rhodospirillales bacterium]|nr:FkbM family methyltransferase [Rhodospirillales bacterium]